MNSSHHSARHNIPFWKKLNPIWWLGNYDRPYDESFTFFGKNIDSTYPTVVRKTLFAIRNPGHNFTHYVIGIADRNFNSFGPFPTDVWAEYPRRLNYAFRIVRFLPLPYLSYRGNKIEFYIGWRQAGNFGLSLRKSQYE